MWTSHLEAPLCGFLLSDKPQNNPYLEILFPVLLFTLWNAMMAFVSLGKTAAAAEAEEGPKMAWRKQRSAGSRAALKAAGGSSKARSGSKS